MTTTIYNSSYRIAGLAGQQEARPSVFHQDGVEKYATDEKTSSKRTETNVFAKCKRPLLVSTFNVRSLNSTMKISELVALAIECNINVMSIQEHRFHHTDVELRHVNLARVCTLVTSSAWKSSRNSTIGGLVSGDQKVK